LSVNNTAISEGKKRLRIYRSMKVKLQWILNRVDGLGVNLPDLWYGPVMETYDHANERLGSTKFGELQSDCHFLNKDCA
jgi:hypothetical protein